MIGQELEMDEAAYPAGFDLQHFRQLPSFKARLAYVKERLPKIARGSARAVFTIDDATVLKVAMNAKGQAQNDVEADIGRQNSYPVAKVYEVGDNGLWLEMEKATKATPKLFRQLAGMDIKAFEAMIRYWHTTRNGRSQFSGPEGYEDAVESGDNNFMNQVLELMANYDMPAGDIGRISSWGVVNRGGKQELVLIDFGLTQTVWDDYYAPKYEPPPNPYAFLGRYEAKGKR